MFIYVNSFEAYIYMQKYTHMHTLSPPHTHTDTNTHLTNPHAPPPPSLTLLQISQRSRTWRTLWSKTCPSRWHTPLGEPREGGGRCLVENI